MTPSAIYLLALTANLFFSSASLIFSIYARRFSPTWMNQTKVSIAFICFLAAALYTGFVPVSINAITLLLLSGLIGLCLGDMLLFKAFTTLGAARGLVLFSFQPLILGIYAWFLLQQGFSSGQAGAVACMMACLFVFLLERNKETGRWDIQSFLWAFAGILLDSVGVMLTRSAYELTPALGAMQVNLIRCFGALIGFFLMSPKSFTPIFFDLKAMKGKERYLLLTACICGTFISLALYLSALKYAHVASLTAVAITGPVWVSILECLWERKLPNRYLTTAFLFFIFGFYLMT